MSSKQLPDLGISGTLQCMKRAKVLGAALLAVIAGLLPFFTFGKGSKMNTKIVQNSSSSLNSLSAASHHRALIRLWYMTYLKRQPSAIELKTDIDLFDVYHQTEAEIHAGVLGSAEYRSTFPSDEAYVKNFYTLLLKREPTAAELKAGIALVEARYKTKLAQNILESAEYAKLQK